MVPSFPPYVVQDVAPPSPPPPGDDCPRPHLGKLCGADAAGAIAGIAIAGAVVLALILAAIIFGFRQKVGTQALEAQGSCTAAFVCEHAHPACPGCLIQVQPLLMHVIFSLVCNCMMHRHLVWVHAMWVVEWHYAPTRP